jgi:hypothetical protein
MSLGINTKPSQQAESRSAGEKSVEKPIFLSGLGRSGTTIIHSILAAHPQANWLSLFTAKFPNHPEINRWLMHGIDIPVLNIPLKKRFVPLENYAFWDNYFGGFFQQCRDLRAGDVSPRVKKSLRRLFGKLVTRQRDRILIKTTGMPRIGFLHEVFPDGKFIHVIRDGRAVSHSRMAAPFWRGWQGQFLFPVDLHDTYYSEWQRRNYSFVALAGLQWMANMDVFEQVKRDCPQVKILEVRYESFCADPVTEVKRMSDFCELPWTPGFESAVENFHVGSENDKWKRELTEDQRAILQDVMRPSLVRYGYEPAPEPKSASLQSVS